MTGQSSKEGPCQLPKLIALIESIENLTKFGMKFRKS